MKRKFFKMQVFATGSKESTTQLFISTNKQKLQVQMYAIIKVFFTSKTADYELAIQTFEEDRYDYNRALAYTLKKDFNGAKNVLDKIDDKTAEDFYLRAIVGARSKDIDLLTTSLTRAIKLDGSIRQRAKEDLEFRNYWDKAEFENALR
jgi:hypothetical protein